MLTLVNETNHEADLIRLILDADRSAGVVVVKSSYDVTGGRPLLSPKQRPVLAKPQSENGAEFEPEGVLGKSGVDVLVVGAAAGNGRTQVTSVSLRIGDWSSCALVFGDRSWRRSMLTWAATDALPFSEIPVSWSMAFGGVSRSNETLIPHSGNPVGKGYIVAVDNNTEGTPLPNVEDPNDVLTRPGQVVQPIGFAPLPISSGLRIEAAVDESKVAGVGRAVFNVAHPRHRLPELRGGERCELHGWIGMSADVFELPAESFVVEVEIESRRYEYVPRIDTVCVFPAKRQLVVTRRATFTYAYRRGVARAARLRAVAKHSGASSHVP